jgi:transcriptional regulator with XRE-family HTH domain
VNDIKSNAARTLGLAILALRNDRKMSQRDLAKASSVAHTTIAAIENGTADPSFETLVRISEDGFGIKLPDLLRAADTAATQFPELMKIDEKREEIRQQQEQLMRLTDSLSAKVNQLLKDEA